MSWKAPSGAKTGGSAEEWRKVALNVMDNRYVKSDRSTLESLHIGLKGFPEFEQAAEKLLAMMKKRK
jgi:hypothetical protein